MTQFPVVFYFSFELTDADLAEDFPYPIGNLGTLAIIKGYVNNTHAQALIDDLYDERDWHTAILEDLQSDYGVHDWGSSPTKDVICIGGYYSNEINPLHVPELVEKWRSRLLSDCPYPLHLEDPRYLPEDEKTDVFAPSTDSDKFTMYDTGVLVTK